MTDTRTETATVEYISYSNSGVARTEEQDGIYINMRIVEKLDLKEGEQVRVTMVPNYYDKVEEVPWRATRVERTGSHNLEDLNGFVPIIRNILEESARDCLSDGVDTDELHTYGWTAEELSKELNLKEEEVELSLRLMKDVKKSVTYCIPSTKIV